MTEHSTVFEELLERHLIAKEITEKISQLYDIDKHAVEQIIIESLPEQFDVKIDDLETPLHDLFRYLRNELMPLAYPRSMTLILQEAIIVAHHSNEVRKTPYNAGSLALKSTCNSWLDYIRYLLQEAHEYYVGGTND